MPSETTGAPAFAPIARVKVRASDVRQVELTIVVVVVIVLVLFPCVVWIFQANYVWFWDSAFYGEEALRINHAAAGGLLAWAEALFFVPSSRPPLLVWLSQAAVPFADSVGGLERALLLTNIGASIVTLWLLFSTVRWFGGGILPALAAVLLCGGAASFIAFNNQFLVENVQAMTVAGIAWVASRAEELPFNRLLSATVLWVALGLLAKTTSLGYVLPFVAYILAVRIITRGDTRLSARWGDFALLLAAIAVTVAAARWYILNWDSMLTHVVEATQEESAVLYGSTNPLLVKLAFWFGKLVNMLSLFPLLSWLIMLFGLAGLGFSLIIQFGNPPAGRLREAVRSGALFGLCLGSTILAGLLAHSKMIEEDPRLFSPMIPVVALFFAWGMATLANNWLSACATLMLLLNWIVVQLVALGLIVTHGSFWWLMAPPVDAHSIALLKRAVLATCDRSREGHWVVIAPDLINFNSVAAGFYAERMREKLGYRCSYTSLGWATTDSDGAVKRLYDINADYVVSLPLDKLPIPEADPFNRITRSVVERIGSSADFELITPQSDELVIYKRRR